MDTDPRLLCPPDLLSLRTVGRKWNNAKFYGEYAALWFFLMAKNEEVPTSPIPEWPSLCVKISDLPPVRRSQESGRT